MVITWVNVPVPDYFVSTVIRQISDQLDDEGADIADSDVPRSDEDGWVWFENLERAEQQLLRALAARGGDEVDSTAVAEDMDMSTQELGGIVGPLNKRMRQERLRPPVRSRQASVSGRRVKRLSVDPDYLPFVRESEPVRKVALRRPVGRSRGGPARTGRPGERQGS